MFNTTKGKLNHSQLIIINKENRRANYIFHLTMKRTNFYNENSHTKTRKKSKN